MIRHVITIVIHALLFCWYPSNLFSQCYNGLTPLTAYTICTSDTISQGAVPAALPQHIPHTKQSECENYNILDYYTGKPTWYRFRCYTTGTFDFLLTYETTDSYEWQLFDITGHHPNDVFTNDTLGLLGNWFVNTLGYKGTAPNQLVLYGCALGPSIGNLLPLNLNITIQSGHDYLLLINHRSTTPDNGYKFTISGGSAVITVAAPALESASAKCGLAQIGIKFSKKIATGSIAMDGSDFTCNSPLFSIVNAVPYVTTAACETDSVTLILSNSITAGNYNISVKKGSDSNTLLDNCHNSIAPGDNISFTVGNARAAFDGPAFCCPNDRIVFTDSSTGNIISRSWDFGNGNTSTSSNPAPQRYPVTANEINVPVGLTIKDADNCIHSVVKNLTILNNCFIAVPSAFTPNQDGRNEYLYPLNAWKAKDLVFRVYNRNGQLVFFSQDWTNKWDGTFKGQPESPGMYIWMLSYIDENNQKISLKGTSFLLR